MTVQQSFVLATLLVFLLFAIIWCYNKIAFNTERLITNLIRFMIIDYADVIDVAVFGSDSISG